MNRRGTFSYNLRFPGQYYRAETGLNQYYFRDYDPQVGRYVESDPMGVNADAGINTFTYARNNPLALIDPDGLCPAVVDTGITIGAKIWRDRCILKGRVSHYEGQYRSQFIGTLVGQEGDCSCNQKTQICIYSLVFYQSERRTPCGGGAFSPWDPLTPGWPRTLKAPVDCKTGKIDAMGMTINGYGFDPKLLP